MSQQIILLDSGWNVLEKEFLDRLTSTVARNGDDDGEIFTVAEQSSLYSVVYTMCSQRAPYHYTSRLYERLKDYLECYFSSKVRDNCAVQDGVARVAAIIAAWKNSQKLVKYIQHVFAYLDRWMNPREADKPMARLTVSALIFQTFQNNVFNPLAESVIRTTLNLIEKSRDLQPSDLTLVYEFVSLLIEMDPSKNTYTERFEWILLLETSTYYNKRAAELLATHKHDVSQYTLAAENLLQRERDRATAILPKSSGPAVLTATLSALLLQTQKEVLGVSPDDKISSPVIPGSFQHLLQNFSSPSNIAHISRIYTLYSFVPKSLPLLAHAFSLHVVRQATSALQSVQDIPIPTQGPAGQAQVPPPHIVLHMRLSHIVPRLAQVHDAAQGLLVSCFRDSPLFAKYMRSALEQVINLRISAIFAPARLFAPHPVTNQSNLPMIPTLPELLANQVDVVLKSPIATGAASSTTIAVANTPTAAQIEASIATLAKLFDLLADKDSFLDHFRKLLAKRLLLSRSASLTFEEAMLNKIRAISGHQSTARIDMMLSDIENTAQATRAYASSPFYPKNGVDVCMRILTLGSWPSYTADTCDLPAPFQDHIDAFEEFYHHSTSSRRLQWINGLGTAVLRAKWLPNAPEVQCSTLQASILLQFASNRKQRTVGDIMNEMKMTAEAFQLQARPLYSGQAPLLVKSPNDRFSPSDILSINDNVKIPPNVKRLKIAPPLTKLPPMAAAGPAPASGSGSGVSGLSTGGVPPQTRPSGAATAVSGQTVGAGDSQTPINAYSDAFLQSGSAPELSETEKKHCIDAHLVRLMKKKKRVHHDALIESATEALKPLFNVDQALLKKRIEELIFRDYLERDAKDAAYYVYV